MEKSEDTTLCDVCEKEIKTDEIYMDPSESLLMCKHCNSLYEQEFHPE